MSIETFPQPTVFSKDPMVLLEFLRRNFGEAAPHEQLLQELLPAVVIAQAQAAQPIHEIVDGHR